MDTNASLVTADKHLFLKNIVAQLVATVGRIGSSTLISILVARFWGAESYGEYAAVISFVMLFRFAADWGLHRLVVREIARDKNNVENYATTSLTLFALTASSAVILILIVDYIVHFSGEEKTLLFLTCLWLVLGSLGFLFSGIFYAFERMDLDAWTVLAEVISVVVLMLLILPNHPKSLILLVAILVISRLFNVAVSVFIYQAYIGGFSRHIDLHRTRLLFYAAIPFGLQIFLVGQSNIHVVFLKQFHSSETTGLYRAAEVIALFPAMFSNIAGNVFYPRLAQSFDGSRATYNRLIQQGFHYMLAGSLPAALGLFLLANQIIVFIYGSEYIGAAIYIRILCLTLPLTFMETLMATAITSANKQGLRTMTMALSALLSVGLGLLLIPGYGAVGASALVLLVTVVRFLLFLFLIAKISGRFYNLKLFAPILLASFLLTTFVIGLDQQPLLVVIFGAASIYILVLLASDQVIRQDIQQVQIFDLLRAAWHQSKLYSPKK